MGLTTRSGPRPPAVKHWMVPLSVLTSSRPFATASPRARPSTFADQTCPPVARARPTTTSRPPARTMSPVTIIASLPAHGTCHRIILAMSVSSFFWASTVASSCFRISAAFLKSFSVRLLFLPSSLLRWALRLALASLGFSRATRLTAIQLAACMATALSPVSMYNRSPSTANRLEPLVGVDARSPSTKPSFPSPVPMPATCSVPVSSVSPASAQ